MIHVDNNDFISNSLNNKNHQCTKHINVKYYFIKQRAKLDHVTFDYILYTNNIANLLMKLLLQNTILKFTRALGLYKEQNATL